MRRQRIVYAAVAVLLIAVEVLIALYVHDRFVRPYLGDVIVVIILYCLVRLVFPVGKKHLSVFIFLFAAGVELLQAVNPLKLLGLGNNHFLRILLGSVCDPADIACYAVGCLLTWLRDITRMHKEGA